MPGSVDGAPRAPHCERMSALRTPPRGRRLRELLFRGLMGALMLVLACDDGARKCDADEECRENEACRWPAPPCELDGGCPAELCCLPVQEVHPAGTGRCRRLGGRGADCIDPSDCRPGLACRGVVYDPDGGASDGHCEEVAAVGAPCEDDGDCQAHLGRGEVDLSTFCPPGGHGGVCARLGTLDVGQSCSEDAQCRRGTLCPYQWDFGRGSVCLGVGTAAGSACDPDAEGGGCDADAFCLREESWSESGVCTRRFEEGEACCGDMCRAGLGCSEDGRCETGAPVDSVCLLDGE